MRSRVKDLGESNLEQEKTLARAEADSPVGRASSQVGACKDGLAEANPQAEKQMRKVRIVLQGRSWSF
jgi:hypothetical protein